MKFRECLSAGCWGVLVAMVICACCGMAKAAAPTTATLDERVDAIAKKTLSPVVAGISIAVARDGRVVFARGYGMANLEHAVAVTPSTVFHIASISKNILAAVVLQLVDEGRLRLDDDVTQYVPGAPMHGRHVTVRQLLNHTSGIYSFTSLPDAADNERRDLTHDQVLALIKDSPPDFEPGTGWRYNNSAFYLAGMVVERVTKQEYGAYVRQHLFQTLGMSSAQMCDARMVVPHLASGYEADGGSLLNASFHSWKPPFAAGAVCMTATDLLRWQAALDAGRVLSPASLALMRTATTLADGTPIDYGLGTRLGSFVGHRVLGHEGDGGGFSTVLESFPDDHVTIVVLMNTRSGPAIAMATDIARAALGLPEKQALRDLPLTREELAAFTGTQFESDDDPVVLFDRDGKLCFRGNLAEGALLRQSEHVYAIDENSEVHFVANSASSWALVYVGGLFLEPYRRVH